MQHPAAAQHGDGGRAACTLAVIHERRDQQRITALALHSDSERVLLGLSSGYVEEYRLVRGGGGGEGGAGGGAWLRLQAERKAFRHAVTAIAPLQAAARAALLSEDGSLALMALETMQVVALAPGQARGAAAIAADRSGAYPPRLAVACRLGKAQSRILVFDVLPGNVTTSLSGQPALLAAQVPVPEAVLDLAWVGRSLLLSVAGGYRVLHGSQLVHLTDQLTVAPMVAAIPAQQLGMLLWEGGLVLVTDASGAAVRPPLLLASRPLALAHAGLFLVAVTDDGVHVFERAASEEVQHIRWLHDDAWVRLAGRLPCADDAGGRCVLLATSGSVLLLEPVALQQQVRELLKRRRYEQALELIDTCRGEGADWADCASAQAGLLLLQDMAVDRAVEVLSRVAAEVLQPAQLLTLFPEYTARWLPQVPGAHPLPPLASIMAHHLERRAAVEAAGHHHHHRHRPRETAEQLTARAKLAVCRYLQHVRGAPGLVLAAAVDTLLVQLLCDCDDAGALERLLTAQHAAEPLDAEVALRRARRWHALALLHAASGSAIEALDVWQGLSDGALQEAPCSTGAVAEAGGDAHHVALAGAAQMLLRPEVPADVVMSRLPWLLRSSTAASLQVLCSRSDLPASGVLPLLCGAPGDPLRWQYLYHLVHEQGAVQSELHTQLAAELLHAVLGAVEQERAHARSLGPQLWADAASQLPLAHAPNSGDPGDGAEAGGCGAQQLARQLSGGGGHGGPASRRPAAALGGRPLAGAVLLSRAGSSGAARPSAAAGRQPGLLSAVSMSLQASDQLFEQDAAAPFPQVMQAGSNTAAPGTAWLPGVRRLPQLQQRVADTAAQQQLAQQTAAPAQAAAGRLLLLRSMLAYHLQASVLYDAGEVVQQLQAACAGAGVASGGADASSSGAAAAPLWPELGLVQSRLGQHISCLRAWAVDSGLVEAAIGYCRALGSQDVWLALLEMCLSPGEGRQPLYAAACRVLAAEGASLNPLKVLQSLADDAPLQAVAPTLERLMGGMQHRRRTAQVVRQLHRAQHLGVAAARAELQAARVVVADDTACMGCQRLLGNRIFTRYPSGVVMCTKCAGGGPSY